MSSVRQISVGGVPVGGGAPVVVQSMTCTRTGDAAATLEQVRALADAGCELVRVSLPAAGEVEAFARVVRESPVPVIADIHFDWRLALAAIEPVRRVYGSTRAPSGSGTCATSCAPPRNANACTAARGWRSTAPWRSHRRERRVAAAASAKDRVRRPAGGDGVGSGAAGALVEAALAGPAVSRTGAVSPSS